MLRRPIAAQSSSSGIAILFPACVVLWKGRGAYAHSATPPQECKRIGVRERAGRACHDGGFVVWNAVRCGSSFFILPDGHERLPAIFVLQSRDGIFPRKFIMSFTNSSYAGSRKRPEPMFNRSLVTLGHQHPSAPRLTLPAIITKSGPRATRRLIEFFTAEIPNVNTRAAYGRAITCFCDWCENRGLQLETISPIAVASYLEQHHGSIPTRKQHLSAIRHLFDYLVTGHILQINPAHAVRGPKHVVKKGKTPVLSQDDARSLLESIDVSTIVGLRDRALLGAMFYSFARVSAAVGMNVEDYYPNGKRWWFRLHEKGGKFHEVPVHHQAERFVDAYLTAVGIGSEKHTPLFRSVDRHGRLTDRRLIRQRVLEMIKRRARQAGLPGDKICCHTARATGITAFLLEGGTIEAAQRIAAHESPRTTSLYYAQRIVMRSRFRNCLPVRSLALVYCT